MRRTIIKGYKILQVEETFDELTDELMEEAKTEVAQSVLYKASEMREEDATIEVVFDGEVYE